MPNADFVLELTPAQAATAAKAVRAMADLRSGRFDVLLALLDEGTIPVWREERQPPLAPDVLVRVRAAFAAAVDDMRSTVRSATGVDADGALPKAVSRDAVGRLADCAEYFAEAAATGSGACRVVVPAAAAHDVDEALELMARIGIGQVAEVERVVYDAVVAGGGYDPVLRGAMEDAGERLRSVLGFRSGHSYGVGSDRIAMEVRSVWEIHKALQRAVAMDRDPNPTFRDVRYDGNSLRWTRDPEPLCRPVDAPAGAPTI